MTTTQATETLAPSDWMMTMNHMLNHLARAGITHVPRHSDELTQAALELLQLQETAVTGLMESAAQPAPVTSNNPPPSINLTAESSSNPPLQKPIAKPFPASLLPSDAKSELVWNEPKLPLADRNRVMASLAEQVSGCTRCEALACRRHRTVFGEGNHQPRVCFFGEAPGADEDRTGRPFVGAAGQLLDRIITACTFKREDVYILNTVKCRPPENRNPTDEEVNNCRAYFETQFETLQPQYIVCLGLVAARALIPNAPSVGRLRGRLHTYRGAQVVVTYHPSYLLRSPSAKAATWDDMKMLLREMGIEIPKRSS